MPWFSALAVYILFWVLCFFLVLPIGIRTADEDDPLVPGQAESAPLAPNLWRKLLWATVLAALMFGLFIANWVQGWITRTDLEALIPF